MQTQREQIIVDDNKMNLFVARPDGDKPLPAIVVIQHQYGVDRFMEEMTARTAAEGYFAVTPDLYHRDGPDRQDDGPTRRGRARDVNIIKDVGATVDYLKGEQIRRRQPGRHPRILHGWAGRLLDGRRQKRFQSRYYLVWRQLLSPVGR